MAQVRMSVSAEDAAQLAVLAKQLRESLFGNGGVPKWGTKFSEIEARAMSAGLELARQIMLQAASEQALGKPPAQSLATPDGTADLVGQADAVIETPAGTVNWKQPKARLTKVSCG